MSVTWKKRRRRRRRRRRMDDGARPDTCMHSACTYLLKTPLVPSI
jgi:hypothetical protein